MVLFRTGQTANDIDHLPGRAVPGDPGYHTGIGIQIDVATGATDTRITGRDVNDRIRRSTRQGDAGGFPIVPSVGTPVVVVIRDVLHEKQLFCGGYHIIVGTVSLNGVDIDLAFDAKHVKASVRPEHQRSSLLNSVETSVIQVGNGEALPGQQKRKENGP